GASFTFGSMTGSASINMSKDKVNSNYDSVKEQTGLFAGQGGYNIKVGNHTQLDGAVIASTADKDKNLLDTGTLGWSDIHNQADYQSEHQSAGFSSGGSIGANLMSNMSALPIGNESSSGHAEGATKSAVSEGGLIIRRQTEQSQDVSQLDRDAENANEGAIDPIFDKEKEQKRLRQAQLVSDIASQSLDIYNTYESTKATHSETDKSVKTGVNAVVRALQALAGGDIKAALAQGAAPYLAEKVKEITTNNADYSTLTETQKLNNLMAHAILGGVVAELSGGNGTAGAIGAATGELAAPAIALVLYGTSDSKALTTQQKENISALATLASGIAGGVSSDSTAGAATGAQAGKNAVENNSLSGDQARETVKQAAESLKNQVRDKLGEGTTSSIANGIINALSETGDSAIGSVDYVADAAMALASCTTGDGYCDRALNDLSGKNQAVADSVAALMKSETWSAVKDTVVLASTGNQAALEATGGMLAGMILPGKKVPGSNIATVENATKAVIDSKKFDYLFGNVKSSEHNADRSTQLAQTMNRLGLETNDVGASVLTEHLKQVVNTKGNVVETYTKGNQVFEVRESLLFGPSGKAAKLETAFEIMPDGSRRFVTTIPKDGKK
ncbi:VENN motif pre-toxin domain-containing protein, partial [Lonsdalea quercina]|uniref:VENN motif pre-toxin domain-containing protein n=1 Tax=Lonsdalea quercina TaxID=71657 RepID=UPI003975F889